MALRRGFYDVLEMGAFGNRAGAVCDAFLVLLIVANVVAVAAETVDSLALRYQTHFVIFEIASVAVFTAEYLLRLWVSVERQPAAYRRPVRDRLAYMATPLAIIDLLAILPFYLAAFTGLDLRFLRIFRLVRLLKLVRYSPAMASLARVVYEERRALLAALLIMSGLLFLAASAIYFVEGDDQPDKYGNIPLSLWWALVTFTTVGYGDVVPMTVEGRLVGAVVMIFGLAFYAIPIGIIASAFSSEIHRQQFVARFGLIAKVPLFANLDVATIGELSRMLRTLVIDPGTVLSRRAADAEGMYFIVSGEVTTRYKQHEVTQGPGDFFGVLPLLTEGPQGITVVARTSCRLFMLETHDFARAVDMSPALADRLGELTHERIETLIGDGILTQAEGEALRDIHQRAFRHG